MRVGGSKKGRGTAYELQYELSVLDRGTVMNDVMGGGWLGGWGWDEWMGWNRRMGLDGIGWDGDELVHMQCAPCCRTPDVKQVLRCTDRSGNLGSCCAVRPLGARDVKDTGIMSCSSVDVWEGLRYYSPYRFALHW